MHQNLQQYFNQFYVLSNQSIAAIDDISTIKLFKKNDSIQSMNCVCKTIYFITKGAARIYYYKNDNDITESFSFENSIIARVESLLTGRPSKKAIQVIEDSEIIAINSVKLFELYNTHSDIETLFRLIFEAGYVDTVHRIESIQFCSATERYTELLKQTPNALKRIPLRHIASYLGITQVSLSRIRAQL